MADDVVDRMRARADAIAESDAAVIESGGRPNARWFATETALREGVDEIERLRAENGSWQLLATIRLNEIEQLRAENQSWRSLDQIRLDLLRQSADELRRLQALIDAYAAACDEEADHGDSWPVEQALDAIYRAATKEDADGR